VREGVNGHFGETWGPLNKPGLANLTHLILTTMRDFSLCINYIADWVLFCKILLPISALFSRHFPLCVYFGISWKSQYTTLL
jgi:hypothetical protein